MNSLQTLNGYSMLEGIPDTRFPKIVFIQGPPRCGKDTTAELLRKFFRYKPLKFAEPIRDVIRTMLPDVYDGLEGWKGEPLGKFRPNASDISVRQFMIDFSEEFVKPRLGKDCFGVAMLEHLRSSYADSVLLGDGDRFCFSDSGFPDEAVPIINHYGPEECCIIQLSRGDLSFKGDSRGYWSLPGVWTYKLQNDGDLVDLKSTLSNLLLSYSREAAK